MNPQSGRDTRFESVAREVYEPLQRYLRRRVSTDDAADLLGDVLLTIWRRLDDVPDDGVLPWSYGVARRVLANHRRGAQRHLRLVERLKSEPPSSVPDPADHHHDDDLARALGNLTLADQEVLRLWAWEHLEPREIAVVLDTTANAVSLRLTRAKKKLSEQLGRQDPTPSGQIGDRHAEEQRP
ncbi:MAG: sigma-70 family RNA polymerase sigma factor [Acidimicrobiia bacterium]